MSPSQKYPSKKRNSKNRSKNRSRNQRTDLSFKEFLPPKFKLKNEELWRPLYPFESHYMRIGGFSYHYLDERPAEWKDDDQLKNRPTLLMVHGNPTWSFFFRNLVLAYRKRYRVIVVDHIGCGLSEKPDAEEYPYHLERRVTDLCYLVKKLNLQNVTLVAHDWGGAVGMGAAVRLHERFSRIVLMNTAAFRSQRLPFRIFLGRIPFFSTFLIRGFNAFCRAALRYATERPGGLPKEVAAGLVAPYDSWKNRVAVAKFVRDIPFTEKDVSYKMLVEIEEGLSLFREKPVLFVWGMRDWCFPPEFLKRFLQSYPEADVCKIESAGHYLLEDALDDVLEATKAFFDKTDAQ